MGHGGKKFETLFKKRISILLVNVFKKNFFFTST